jgi:hypothetical protein
MTLATNLPSEGTNVANVGLRLPLFDHCGTLDVVG